jgi:protein-disulfide isomerase
MYFMEPTTDNNYYPQPRNNFLVPVAIVIAGVLIAGSLIYLKRGGGQNQVAASLAASQSVGITVNPVTDADHTRGNPNAKIQLIEYSDTECPFCQRYEPTVEKLLTNYGKDGTMSWTYRHFALHERSLKEAEAAECAAELGGNNAFWKFIDTMFAKKHFQTSATDKYVGVDPTELPGVGQEIGLNKTSFASCLNSGKYTTKIQQQYNEAVAAGALGTPHTILVSQKEVSREISDFVTTINQQMLAKMSPGTQPPFAISSDKKKIVVSGAMDYAIMDELVKMLVRIN